MQGADGVRVHFGQEREDFGYASFTFRCSFGPFPVSSYLDMRARLLLAAAALTAFGGSLVGGFHLDDYAIFSGASRSPFGWPHPLTQFLTWLNYQLAGRDAIWYHAVNLLLHVGAVLLAYECLRRILPATAAGLAAGIFAVHPLQAEAVDYISARVAMVVAILAFAAMLAWLVGRRWVAMAFAALLLAEIPAPMRAYAYAGGALRFLRLFMFPWGFTIAPDIREPVWLSLAAAVAIVGVAAWRWRKFSMKSRLTWLLVGLLLLIPGTGPNPAAVFAFSAAAGLLLARIPGRAAGIAMVVIFAAIGVSRTYVWMSDERLWREAVRRAPELVEPKIQLAKSLRAADALDLLNRTRQQAPYNAEIPAQIGKVLLDEQQYESAVDELSRAVALDPRNALAFNNRGVALAALGQFPAAAADFNQALVLDPHLAEARENLKRLAVR
jgi:tetratricopeptide (TPR) repeat protein